MTTAQAQSVFNKVDLIQYHLDKAIELAEEVMKSADTLAVDKENPLFMLKDAMSAIEDQLCMLSDKHMKSMMTDLKSIGAREDEGDAPVPAAANPLAKATSNINDASTRNTPTTTPAKRPAPSPPSPAPPRTAPKYIPPPSADHPVAYSTPTTRGNPNQLPLFKEDLGAADKLMIKLKTGKKHTWEEIADRYERMVGKGVKVSTVASRWQRMKQVYGEDELEGWAEGL